MTMGQEEPAGSDTWTCNVEKIGPFFGIFGNTKNAELLQLLLSVPDLELNKSRLSRVLNTTFPTVNKILKLFERYNIITVTENTKTNEKICRLNSNSSIVQIMNQFNLMLSAHESPAMELLLHQDEEPIKLVPTKPSFPHAVGLSPIIIHGRANLGLPFPALPPSDFANTQSEDPLEVVICPPEN